MVKLNKIYTRTGDAGTTGLVDGSRVSKADARMAAIGDVDEANSAIGVALSSLGEGPIRDALNRIQNDLFDLGADLATPGDIDWALRVTARQSAWLEQTIDTLNADMPPLASFILPAGDPGAAALHLARAITRRAERSAVACAADTAISPEILIYLNRLSDYLFVAARHVNQSAGADVLWIPGASR
ncbi:cob(I)yrinic acid a,c-diamide adenosyltransferase [Sphingomonas donggukensis]|uniref:Corrinoid adenosyltransferase n=1 Tax=Sphingomonas donggukensis TaxID=2949093 RepID=A0ABY4TRE3_9SPHN|nr:cob(I)yrinic acid a,c-diamide adenosyltransferase [Sphingomonas donggukensis]URW74955.1 cob(I)yrinic acid a,c-diamide adenosyltransferase [Sphingomonas donggukensis]